MNSRDKGNNYELKMINWLKGLGFKAVSSRSESKNMDNKGVDIITDFPFHIQCKATERTPPYHDILKSMPDDKFRCILHKRNQKGSIVVMPLEAFEHIQRAFQLARSITSSEIEGIEKAIEIIRNGDN